MKNTTITIIIITLLLCIAGFGVWTAMKSDRLGYNTKPANPAAKDAKVMAVTSNTLASAGSPSASEMLDEFSKRKPGEVAQVKRKPPTREELKKRKQEWIARDMKNRRNELNSKNVIYSALYDRLNLPNQKLNILKDLLVELEFAGSTVGLKYFDLNWKLTKDDRNKDIKDYKDGIASNIKDLLNDNDEFAYTMRYIETLNQRAEANAVNDYFKNKAEPLTTVQMDALIDILYNRAGIGAAAGLVPHDFYGKSVLNGQYTVEKATGILTPAQLTALRGYYDKISQQYYKYRE